MQGGAAVHNQASVVDCRPAGAEARVLGTRTGRAGGRGGPQPGSGCGLSAGGGAAVHNQAPVVDCRPVRVVGCTQEQCGDCRNVVIAGEGGNGAADQGAWSQGPRNLCGGAPAGVVVGSRGAQITGMAKGDAQVVVAAWLGGVQIPGMAKGDTQVVAAAWLGGDGVLGPGCQRWSKGSPRGAVSPTNPATKQAPRLPPICKPPSHAVPSHEVLGVPCWSPSPHIQPHTAIPRSAWKGAKIIGPNPKKGKKGFQV